MKYTSLLLFCFLVLSSCSSRGGKKLNLFNHISYSLSENEEKHRNNRSHKKRIQKLDSECFAQYATSFVPLRTIARIQNFYRITLQNFYGRSARLFFPATSRQLHRGDGNKHALGILQKLPKRKRIYSDSSSIIERQYFICHPDKRYGCRTQPRDR